MHSESYSNSLSHNTAQKEKSWRLLKNGHKYINLIAFILFISNQS